MEKHCWKGLTKKSTLKPVPGKLPKDLSKMDDFEPYAYQLERWDEQQFLVIQKQVLFPWERAWKAKDIKGFQKLIKKGSKLSTSWQKPFNSRLPYRVKENITEYRWSLQKQDMQLSSNISAAINKYLRQYKKVEGFKLETFRVKNFAGDRNPDLSIKTAQLSIRFDIRGVTKQNLKRNDRGMLRVDVENVKGKWKIKGLKVENAESLIASSSTFADRTVASGVAGIKNYTRQEAIRRGGYTLSMNDYDGDGNVDMYVGAMGKSQLLKGNGKGQFIQVKNSGLEEDTLVKSAIFADFNNNGQKDLLVVRFDPASAAGESNDILYYQNEGNGKFKRIKNMKQRNDSMYAMPAAVADFDGNGLLDFYVGFPGAKDFTVVDGRMSSMKGKQVQGLFYNDGKGMFKDVTSKLLAESSNLNHAQKLYPHSSVAADYDLDGDMDIIVIDDRANLSPVYTNQGKGTFVQNAEPIGLGNEQYGMGTAVGDIDNDGIMDFAMSNVNFLAAERMKASSMLNWDLSTVKTGLQGLRLFKGGPNGKYADVTNISDLTWYGEGVAGIEFVDYNNDGNLDLYVLNGLWSGTSRDEDLGSFFMRSLWKNDFHFEGAFHTGDEQDRVTQSIIMNILMKYRGEVTVPFKKGKAEAPSLAGFQRNRLYRNNGDGSFTEVGYLEGVDSIADGYVASIADINKDGKMDLIVRNCDPGVSEDQFPTVEVFVNQTKNKKNSAVIALESTYSNKDAIGAIAVAKIGKTSYTRHLIANNGTAQSESVIHFGMGNAKKIDQLSIKWPSGNVENYYDVKPGYHKIVESNSHSKVSGL